MENNETQKYLLAIKRGNNDYLPLEWNLTQYYHNENLNTLEGIDAFTKNVTKQELLLDVIRLNMIGLDERFVDFTIIYPANDKFYELKEGCIFKSDQDILDENAIISYIIANKNNKDVLNKITNLCKGKTSDSKVEEFKYLVKNLNLFIDANPEETIKALQKFKSVKYENRRSILIKLSKRVIIPELRKEYS